MSRIGALVIVATVGLACVALWWLIVDLFGWVAVLIVVGGAVVLEVYARRAARQLAHDLDEADRWQP